MSKIREIIPPFCVAALKPDSNPYLLENDKCVINKIELCALPVINV